MAKVKPPKTHIPGEFTIVTATGEDLTIAAKEPKDEKGEEERKESDK